MVITYNILIDKVNAVHIRLHFSRLGMDRIKLGLRFGEDNFAPNMMINDCLDFYEGSFGAQRLRARRYPNNPARPRRTRIDLPGLVYASIVVETGTAIDRNRRRQPYATFAFNLNRLLFCTESRCSFHRVFEDLVPGGGYRVLIEDGFVLYVEYEIDFMRINMQDVEVFHPLTMAGDRIGPRGMPPETIYLKKLRERTPNYCIYDKALQLRRKTNRRARTSRVRVEARLRLNANPCLRATRATTLATLDNPFRDLHLYEKPALEWIFATSRHRNFLERIHDVGLQAALGRKDNADRQRRIRMLEGARAPYWEPAKIWEEQHRTAIQELIALQPLSRRDHLNDTFVNHFGEISDGWTDERELESM